MEKQNDKYIIDEISKLRGIGKWSSSIFCMFNMQRENVFVLNDNTLDKIICKIYKIQKSELDSFLNKYINIWSPYNSYICRYLWQINDMGLVH